MYADLVQSFSGSPLKPSDGRAVRSTADATSFSDLLEAANPPARGAATSRRRSTTLEAIDALALPQPAAPSIDRLRPMQADGADLSPLADAMDEQAQTFSAASPSDEEHGYNAAAEVDRRGNQASSASSGRTASNRADDDDRGFEAGEPALDAAAAATTAEEERPAAPAEKRANGEAGILDASDDGPAPTAPALKADAALLRLAPTAPLGKLSETSDVAKVSVQSGCWRGVVQTRIAAGAASGSGGRGPDVRWGSIAGRADAAGAGVDCDGAAQLGS